MFRCKIGGRILIVSRIIGAHSATTIILCIATFFAIGELVTDSTVLTSVDTIHTSHAARVVHLVFVAVDARRFTFARAKAASVAFALVDIYFEEGIS